MLRKSLVQMRLNFRLFSAETLASEDTPKVNYQENTTSKSETHFEMLKKLELSKDSHFELINYCNDLNIKFLSTPYDIEKVQNFSEIGVDMYKTSSADLIDLPLQKFLAFTGKPLIVATWYGYFG